MMPLFKKLRDPEADRLRNISMAIADIKHTPGWGCFREAANALIEASFPNVTEIATNDMQTFVASRMCYIQGIRDCLDIVDKQETLLKQFLRK